MADLRTRTAIKIVDPTTDANEVGVDASGNLQVVVNAAIAAGTNNIGDVDVLTFPTEVHSADYDTGAGTDTTLTFGIAVPASGGAAVVPGDGTAGLKVDLGADNDVTVTGAVDTELPAAAALADNAGNPTAPAVGAFGMWFDGTTWDRAQGTSADGLLVNLGTNNDVTVSGAVDTELPAAAALTDADANPTVPAVGSFLMGFDGTDWQRVRVNASNELLVTLPGAPTAPKIDTLTSATLAAGSSASLDGTQVASGLTGKLAAVSVSASVPIKAEVRTALNGAYTVRQVLFAKAGEPAIFVPPHKNYITQAENATAGFDGFNLNITNMDNSQAADVYGTILWDEE